MKKMAEKWGEPIKLKAEIYHKEAFQAFCPLGCGWQQALFIGLIEAEVDLRKHLKEFHNVKPELIQIFEVKGDAQYQLPEMRS